MLARRMARPLAPLALAAALVAGGGSREADRPNATATIVLAGPASAGDAGIDLAVARDFDGAEGAALGPRRPAGPSDGLRRLLDGNAEFAVLDIHDLARARARGRDVVGVMAIVQRPLAAVLAGRAVRRPRDLEGARVGVSAARADAGVRAAIVRHDGGAARRVRRVRIARGTAAAAVQSGRV